MPFRVLLIKILHDVFYLNVTLWRHIPPDMLNNTGSGKSLALVFLDGTPSPIVTYCHLEPPEIACRSDKEKDIFFRVN